MSKTKIQKCERLDIITPATKYIKVVIPANPPKADKSRNPGGHWMPDQVRYDGVSLFNCRVDNKPEYLVLCTRLNGQRDLSVSPQIEPVFGFTAENCFLLRKPLSAEERPSSRNA